MKSVFAAFVCGMAVSVSCGASVYDDVAFWLRPYDRTGLGRTTGRSTDMVNVPAARTNINFSANIYGRANSLQLAQENVVLPVRGVTLPGQTVFRFTQEVEYPGDGTSNIYPNVIRISKQENNAVNTWFTNLWDGVSEYTLMTRFRRQAPCIDTSREGRMLSFFYHAAQKRGVQLAYESGASAENGRLLKVYYAGSAMTAKAIPTNVWVDAAIVSSNGGRTLNVYLAMEGAPSMSAYTNILSDASASLAPLVTVGEGFSLGHVQAFGAKSGVDHTAITEAMRAFRGDIQHVAMWKRALSEDDVREAFASPCPEVFRIGMENGSADEFAYSPSGSAFPAYGAEHLAPPGLAAGASCTFTFSADPTNALHAQVFRLVPTAASGSGRVSLSVNGADLGSRTVCAGKTAMWFVPENTVACGANSATLARTDSGAEAVEWDVLSLGGSWQLGSDDNKIATDGTEFGDNVAMDFRVESGYWGRLSRNVKNNPAANSLLRIRFDVPDGAAARYGFVYETAHKPNAYQGLFELRLNGTLIHSDSVGWTRKVSVRLPQTLLADGENTLEWKHCVEYAGTTAYTNFDFHRLRVSGELQGLSLLLR